MVQCKEAEPTWVGRSYFSRSIFFSMEGSTQGESPIQTGQSEKGGEIIHLREFERCNGNHHSLLGGSRPLLGMKSKSFSNLFALVTKKKPSLRTRSLFSREAEDNSRSLGKSRLPNNHDCQDREDDQNMNGDVQGVDANRVISWPVNVSVGRGETPAKLAEEWMVDLSQLFLGQKFASGSYSHIYRGIYKDNVVAVKVMRQPNEDKCGDEEKEAVKSLDWQFRCEVEILSRLHHPNIVKFIGAYEKPSVHCIIMEYLPGGSLRSYLQNEAAKTLPFHLVMTMALDIAHGMEYLHACGIIHRDLKSGNLVLTEDLHVKVTDFGAAFSESASLRAMDNDVGTYRWMAPEMISHKPYSRKVDIYSYGIIMWELLTGKTPFEELSAVQAAFAVVHKHARPDVPLDCPVRYKELMQQCWSADPMKRPEFTHIISVLVEETQKSLDSEWGDPQKHNGVLFTLPHKLHPKGDFKPRV